MPAGGSASGRGAAGSQTAMEVDQAKEAKLLRQYPKGVSTVYNALKAGETVTYKVNGETITARWNQHGGSMPHMELKAPGRKTYKPITATTEKLVDAAHAIWLAKTGKGGK